VARFTRHHDKEYHEYSGDGCGSVEKMYVGSNDSGMINLYEGENAYMDPTDEDVRRWMAAAAVAGVAVANSNAPMSDSSAAANAAANAGADTGAANAGAANSSAIPGAGEVTDHTGGGGTI
jgi:hypothetical protein